MIVQNRLVAFIANKTGQYVNVTNNPYGAQCVELCNAWCDALGIERFPGNAADFEFDSHPDCDWIANTPTNMPVSGDIVVWGKSASLQFGHVGIAVTANDMSLTTFDENWPLHSPAHVQPHTYVGVFGWLRPKEKIPVPDPVPSVALPIVPPPQPLLLTLENVAAQVATLQAQLGEMPTESPVSPGSGVAGALAHLDTALHKADGGEITTLNGRVQALEILVAELRAKVGIP